MLPQAHSRIVGDIAKGVAMTCLIVALSQVIPLLAFCGSLFLPLPILFYRAKLGRFGGLIIMAIAVVTIRAFIVPFNADLFIWLDLMVLGFVLSELFERNLTVEKTIIYGCGIVLIPVFVWVAVHSSIAKTGLFDLIAGFVDQNIDTVINHYRQLGLSQESLALMQEGLMKASPYFVRLMPGVTVVSALLIAWFNILMARPLFVRRMIAYPNYGPLRRWKAPDALVWALIACGTMALMPLEPVSTGGLNGLLILLSIYFFEGIAIVAFFFEKKAFPRLVRVFLYTLIGLQHLLLVTVIVLGVFDIWFDFRKLKTSIDTRL